MSAFLTTPPPEIGDTQPPTPCGKPGILAGRKGARTQWKRSQGHSGPRRFAGKGIHPLRAARRNRKHPGFLPPPPLAFSLPHPLNSVTGLSVLCWTQRLGRLQCLQPHFDNFFTVQILIYTSVQKKEKKKAIFLGGFFIFVDSIYENFQVCRFSARSKKLLDAPPPRPSQLDFSNPVCLFL